MSVVGRVQINRPGAAGAVLPPTIPDDPPPGGGGGETAYLDIITADGAVAVWPLTESDGTTTYADVVGAADGTVSKGVTSDWASAPIGPSTTASPLFNGAAGFDNAADDLSVRIAHDAVFEVGTDDFAMEAWFLGAVFPDAGTAYTLLFLGKPDVSSYIFPELQGPGAGGDWGQLVMADAAGGAARTGTVYDDHVLHHCVFTRRSGSYFIIVDGAEVATSTPTIPVDLSTDEVMDLAGLYYGALGFDVYSLKGQLAWCAWYRNGLTADQAAAHYGAGAP